MSKSKRFSVLAVFVIASLVLAACGGPHAACHAGPSEQKVTASGYTCPDPEPRMEVASKELNLFVWTEYIPVEMQECFELVYDIKVNRDEYSSNEEMYAKLSAGGTAYDLVQRLTISSA